MRLVHHDRRAIAANIRLTLLLRYAHFSDIKPAVFNRGSAEPKGSVSVSQGFHQQLGKIYVKK